MAKKRRNIGVIGVPLDLGAGRRGVDMGPSAIRIAGLERELEQLGHKVEDCGDIDVMIAETSAIGSMPFRATKDRLRSRTIAHILNTLDDDMRTLISPAT